MHDYVKQLRWARLRIGVVFTVAICVLFITVMFAGTFEKFLTPEVEIEALFSDVKGLRGGSPVWFAGVEIGSVKSITFEPDQKIRVMMSIDYNVLRYLRQDSEATVLTLGLLGDKYVEISPGTSTGSPLRPGNSVNGKSQVEIQDIVETSRESITKISDFVVMLEEILTKIEKGEGTVSKFIQDPTVYNNLKETTTELSKLAGKLRRGEGSLGRLVSDEELYGNISSSVRDVKTFAESLRASEGTLHRVIMDPSLYERFLKASESLDIFAGRLESSRGTVSKLIEDESLYVNVNAVSERLNMILEKIERGDGVMGTLVSDDQLSEELKTTIRELNLLVKEIREHPGRFFRFSLF
jgi:phospholipid/cholesterol/gamma-HCH transport system substrate-binding protein